MGSRLHFVQSTLAVGLLIGGGAAFVACGESSATGSQRDAAPPQADTGDGARATFSCPDDRGGHARGAEHATLDLDGDGVVETTLRLGGCADGGAATCLLAESSNAAIGAREWRLAPTAMKTGMYSLGIYAIGKRGEDALSYIAVGSYDVTTLRPHVAVVDPNGDRGVVASVAAPEAWTIHDTWFGLVRAADGSKLPFIAPGSHYVPRKDGIADWSFACQFDPAKVLAPDAACGTGFRSVGTMFTAAQVAGTLADPQSSFRHNGGFLADADGDGWDDLHLPYLWVIHTVSGKTGQSLGASVVDVSQMTEPNAPTGFHSGRFYGSFTPFADNGKERVLVAAANPVGSFDDVNCNVSRYIAVLDRASGAASKLEIAWSRYEGFTKNTFATPLDTQKPVITRPGDMVNRCIHRFSDSYYRAGDANVVVYSRFASQKPAYDCVSEQVAEIASNFTKEKMDAWTQCARDNFLPTLGRWSIEVLRLADGSELSNTPDRYVWGTSARLQPGCERVFLLEEIPNEVRYDRVGAVPPTMVVATLAADGRWIEKGRFPYPGRPKLVTVYPGERGPGATYGGLPELSVADRDGDGLDEIELDTAWIGWSASANAFVRK